MAKTAKKAAAAEPAPTETKRTGFRQWRKARHELSALMARQGSRPDRPGFTSRQIAELKADLRPSNVKGRKQGNSTVSYIESWHAINEANRIFGFDGWSSGTDTHLVHAAESVVRVERNRQWVETDCYAVAYTARVRIEVPLPSGRMVFREGTGYGDARVYRTSAGFLDVGGAHESAIKEAESDARKRALSTFGNQFGLALYDKERRYVSNNGPDYGDDATPPQPENTTVPQGGTGAPATSTSVQGADRSASAPPRDAERQKAEEAAAVNRALDKLGSSVNSASAEEAKRNMQAPLNGKPSPTAAELADLQKRDRTSLINPTTSFETLTGALVELFVAASGGIEAMTEWGAKQKRERTRRFMMPSHVAALEKAWNHFKDACNGHDVGKLDLSKYGLNVGDKGQLEIFDSKTGEVPRPAGEREPGQDDDAWGV